MALIDDLKIAFPWLAEIGLSASWLQETAATSASSAEIVEKIRGSNAYRARFPGLRRQDGSLRMSEAQYMQQETTYRNLLKQFGFDDRAYATPSTLVGFFQEEIDPNELRDRLTVNKGVKDGGQPFKDAFYVYAGIDLSDDDVFEYIVDPAARQRLDTAYNQNVAGQAFTRQDLIQRATERGLANVATELNKLKARGAINAEAVQRILSIDPGFAQELMGAIYQGTDPSGPVLDLQPLLDAFEFAAIGAAAKNAGLELPTKERLAEIRAAGVEKQKAIAGYADFGKQRQELNAAVQRARGRTFSQSDFEDAAFLGNAEQSRALESGLAYMAAAGRDQGEFRFDETRSGRIVQRGFSNY